MARPSPVLNIVPPVEDRPIRSPTIANRHTDPPLSPSAAIAAATRGNPHRSRLDSSPSFTDLTEDSTDLAVVHRPRRDKASVVLGIAHRKSMEPIPASARTSIATSRSVPNMQQSSNLTQHTATTPLTSLYVVSGVSLHAFTSLSLLTDSFCRSEQISPYLAAC